MDEKRQRTDDAAGPSKIPESWNSGQKGKEKKIPAFKFSSDIEQQTDLKKVLVEEIATKSNYATTAGIRVSQSSGAKASF